MTTQMVPHSGGGSIVEQTTEGYWRFAQMVVKSGLAPRSFKTPEQVMIALEMGRELGFQPMQSLQAIAVINGKPSVWGDAAKALVERSPECEYVKEWTEGDGDTLTAFCEAKRRSRPEAETRSFSWKDAQRAGLVGKDTYKQYPKRMLQMRARSFALRDQFADLLCGFILAEEAQDYPTDNTIRPGDTIPATAAKSIVDAMKTDADGTDDVELPEAFGSDETPENASAKATAEVFGADRAPTPEEAPDLYSGQE